MRKLMLATVAMLGASVGVASLAEAQTASPAPGTVTVRLNGRFRFYAYASFDQDANNNIVGASGTTSPMTGYNKQSSYGFANYVRLYPGFDGVAANGLKYGASLEIRQDNVSGAGGGTVGSVSATNRDRGKLYLRRSWGYIGTDQLGTLRLGSTDQPSSLYMVGNFENFNDGGWNGDAPGWTNALAITWPFADVGSFYSTTKAVYLSPSFAGFDFGVSYEPNTAAITGQGASGCYLSGGIAGPGCDRLSSTPVNAETARRRNTVNPLIRYRGTFGGFGIAATAAYIGGSNVKDNSGQPFQTNPLKGNIRYEYEGVSVGDFGAAVTYAGFSVGGKYQFGRFTGSGINPVPKGMPDGDAWLVGASYTVGPVIVGAHYLDYTSAGNLSNAYFGRQLREQGIAAGGTYTVAPGLNIFLSYLWGQRKQNGYDFITGSGVTSATGINGTTTHNKVSVNYISLGTSFTW